jgi:indoleamine 2,3-dioxygenase
MYPFLEYSSYALFNYAKIDPKGNLDPGNTRAIRLFEGSKDEDGFVLAHIGMVQHSGDLVKFACGMMDAAEAKDRAAFDKAITNQLENTKLINQKMDLMWTTTKPETYSRFRTFIFGVKDQPMFPNGVVLEVVNNDEPVWYRGETGANDSLVPSLDNLMQMFDRMPDNPLTKILEDFRKYRPKTHNDWLTYVQERAKDVKVREFALEDANSAVTYNAILDQIAEIRERHWRFTKSYILNYTKYPRATGGSPIITWLPNQLSAVMNQIEIVGNGIDVSKLSPEKKEMNDVLIKRASTQKRILAREVEELKKKFPDEKFSKA